ncbi:hypothetical protein [Hyphomonas sp.]|uniref:hypothetical protein n=1 Tax=Hyphomonas sp. TaxID=87 RepID=UPI0032ED87CE
MKFDKLAFENLSDYDKGVAIRNATRACAELANGTPLSDLSDDALMAYVIMRQLDYHLAVAEAAKRGPAAVVLN